jgi:fumarate reductase flavoprotein subunit
MTETWDVAIVGAGTAGIPTAIFAAERGARVILIDAADRIGGTLHLSSGSLSAAGGAHQAARGIEDSPEQHLAEALRINHGTGDRAKLELWIQEAGATADWLLELGLQVGNDQPSINAAHEPYERARIYSPPRGGLAHIDCLSPVMEALVASGKVDLRLSTRMTELVTDTDGAVVGLRTVSPDGAQQTIQAKSVVLATGGYAHSAKYWRELHGLPKKVWAYPFSKGDGLTSARALGGRIVHTENAMHTVGGTEDIDEPGKYWIHTRNSPVFRAPKEIFVNLHGRRFMPEDKPGPDRRERVVMNQPEMVFWAILDERIRNEDPPFFLWDRDKVDRAFREHEDFQKADSIEALAIACALDPKVLRQTVDRYNAGQAVGSDEFERQYLPSPIDQPPFYAVKHHSIAVMTFAGIETNESFSVLGADGAPIQNLYAVGEVLGGGVFGNAFLGGMMVSSAMSFGRLLGQKILSW